MIGLIYLDGCSYEEAAEPLQLALGTIERIRTEALREHRRCRELGALRAHDARCCRRARGLGPTAARRAYTCADGRRVTLAAVEPRPWAVLCRKVDLPELDDHPGAPPSEQAGIAARVEAAFASRPAAH